MEQFILRTRVMDHILRIFTYVSSVLLTWRALLAVSGSSSAVLEPEAAVFVVVLALALATICILFADKRPVTDRERLVYAVYTLFYPVYFLAIGVIKFNQGVYNSNECFQEVLGFLAVLALSVYVFFDAYKRELIRQRNNARTRAKRVREKAEREAREAAVQHNIRQADEPGDQRDSRQEEMVIVVLS